MLKRDGILSSVLTTHQFVWEIILWYYIGFIYNILKRFRKLIYHHEFKPLISVSNYISDLYGRYTASIDTGGKLKTNASQKQFRDQCQSIHYFVVQLKSSIFPIIIFPMWPTLAAVNEVQHSSLVYLRLRLTKGNGMHIVQIVDLFRKIRM